MEQRRGFDSTLVVEAQQGDEAALSQILQRMEPMLRAFFIDRIGVKNEIDDLIQNTLIRINRGLKDLRDPRRLKAFTMKAALFELQDLYRGRYHAKERLFDPEFPPEHPDERPTAGTTIDIDRALSVLSPKARQIITLREYGYRYEEIAQMVDSTEAAVKMQVKRAFEKMRKLVICIILTWWLFNTALNGGLP